MPEGRRNRRRRALKRRVEINLDGFDIDLSFEDVLADLNFGVGPFAATDFKARPDRPEIKSVA